MTLPTERRCAVYTRKSTDEGLDQQFTSLDAQREACEAFIRSHRAEGWLLADGHYDDGGYSGGSMGRPGLQALINEVEAGNIDIIVVYKVDRLTRNLSDFARIVDVLDRKGACFVSVTQPFNTTSSMGRLTLNVLLSFAQFEREVTGERIRDKIAASKARGIWMGGRIPLGYVLGDRKLLICPPEAEQVRYIFSRYLELGSVYALQADLAACGIRTREVTLRDGRRQGGGGFSRGALYQMLRNRVYRGQVEFKGNIYAGQHDAIVDEDMFVRVGALLDENKVDHAQKFGADSPSLLAGLIWDEEGRRMTPNHSTRKGNVRYRYYISRVDKDRLDLPIIRLPAGDIERLIIDHVRNNTGAFADESVSRETMLGIVKRVVMHAEHVHIDLHEGDALRVPAKLIKCSGEARILAPSVGDHVRRDPSLIKLIVRAYQARATLAKPAIKSLSIAADAIGVSKQYFCTLLRLSYLAPDIVSDILGGRQPAHLNRQFLARIHNLPSEWAEQRAILGLRG